MNILLCLSIVEALEVALELLILCKFFIKSIWGVWSWRTSEKSVAIEGSALCIFFVHSELLFELIWGLVALRMGHDLSEEGS